MISEMEKKSQESVKGDNYLPLKYREWAKQGKPKEGRVRVEREQRREQLPEEIESMFQGLGEDDMDEIAGSYNVIKVHFVCQLFDVHQTNYK